MVDILAQSDPLSGGGGWLGAGLLGLVLAWLLLKHLPDKDKFLTDTIDKKERVIEAQKAEFTAALHKQTSDHKAALSEIVEHCREENEHVRSTSDRQMSELTNTIRQLADAIRADRKGPDHR